MTSPDPNPIYTQLLTEISLSDRGPEPRDERLDAEARRHQQ